MVNKLQTPDAGHSGRTVAVMDSPYSTECVWLSILGNVIQVAVKTEENQSQHGEIDCAG